MINALPAVLQDAAASRLSVTVPASTLTTSNVLQITWTAATPRAAQAGANAFAAAYLSYRRRELAGQVASLSPSSEPGGHAREADRASDTELSRTSSGRPRPRASPSG